MEFDGFVAASVAQKIIDDCPETELTFDYLIGVIKWSCQGDAYWQGHHGAFDAYLSKLSLHRIVCPCCNESAIVSEDTEFCSQACIEEFYSDTTPLVLD